MSQGGTLRGSVTMVQVNIPHGLLSVDVSIPYNNHSAYEFGRFNANIALAI